MKYPWWTLIALPYTRREWPGWGRLMRRIGVLVPMGDASWAGAPTRMVRGTFHGYRMRLDLCDWSERMTYFLGRYYELHVQLLLQAVLRPGDRFVDFGANIGMIALVASLLVGLRGSVDCFEPNPSCVATIEHHLTINEIQHVCVHPMALSDKAGQLRLNLTSQHTGTAVRDPHSSGRAPSPSCAANA